MITKLIELFIAFFKVGLLSFGGGYTLIPLIQQQVVDVHQWITHEEFLKVLGASQAIPGAISVKFATYVGYKEAGIMGVLVSLIGSFIVPVVLILVLFNVLKRIENIPLAEKPLKAIKQATWGLVIGFGVQSFLNISMTPKNITVGVLAFIGLVVFKMSPAIVIISAGILGFFLY